MTFILGESYSLDTASEDVVSDGNRSNVSKRMVSALAVAKPPLEGGFSKKVACMHNHVHNIDG